MKYSLLTLISCFLFIAACKKDKEGFKTTESGLKYKILISNNGKKPELGDVMLMHIIYKTDKDSLLFDSKTKTDSFSVVLVEPTFKGGVEEGFAMLGIGDSAQFKVSADSIFEKTFHTELPSYMKPGSAMYFWVSMKNIVSKSVKDSLERAHDIEARQDEFKKIEEFLKLNDLDVMPTENGVYLKTVIQGKGDNVQKGDTVYLDFVGRLLDGTIFEQSEGKEPPFHFVFGETGIISGWEDALPLLNKGSRARMVIPSDLAFGAKGKGKIPPYATLVFDVEVRDIKKGVK